MPWSHAQWSEWGDGVLGGWSLLIVILLYIVKVSLTNIQQYTYISHQLYKTVVIVHLLTLFGAVCVYLAHDICSLRLTVTLSTLMWGSLKLSRSLWVYAVL